MENTETHPHMQAGNVCHLKELIYRDNPSPQVTCDREEGCKDCPIVKLAETKARVLGALYRI